MGGSPGLKEGWVDCDLKELRKGLTVIEAAKRAGVNRRNWQRWEKVGRMPKDVLEWFQQHKEHAADG